MRVLNESGLYLSAGTKRVRTVNDIKKMSKRKSKKMLKEKLRDAVLKYLTGNNEEKSKMKNLRYYKLELQDYLKSDKISTKRKKILFKFRTRMVNVGHNFGNKNKCPLCKTEEDTQKHMLECFVMKLNCPEIYHSKQTYDDIFNLNEDILVNMAELCEKAIRTREILNQ